MPLTTGLLALGDSKTDPGFNTWPTTLASDISTSAHSYIAYNKGVSAATAASMAAAINTTLATVTSGLVTPVVIDIGVNDFGGGSSAATWQNNVLTVVDAVHAKWPGAQVWITKPWKQGQDAEADEYATRVDAVVVARSAFTFALDDERGWLKTCVATCTTDGIHFFTATGQSSAVTAKRTALGL